MCGPKKLWVHDLRTNAHFTLKTNPLKRTDLDDFVACYRAENRHQRRATWSDKKPEGQWRSYDYKEIVARDKCSLDVFWLKDESLEATQNLPPPADIAREIVEDLRAALEQFESVAADLGECAGDPAARPRRAPCDLAFAADPRTLGPSARSACRTSDRSTRGLPMDAARSPVQPGDILAGKYRIERVLGAGGMGVVVVATHLDLLETRAIKFMLPEALTNADAVERFVREARAASLLKSEHVARVFDVGRLETGAPYMVMEHLEGTDLDVVLKCRGQLPIGEGVLYVLQTVEALAEAHGRGIIHRDLKPSNLFISARANGSPSVKVLDFGISKIIGAPSADGDLTKEHTVLGSPHYMSPEQMRSSRDVDGRSDIWSLGVILYMILTAQRPFRGQHVGEIIARVMSGPPRPPSRHRRDLPPELGAVIMRCLEREPEARFADVSELAKALLPFAPEGSARLVEGIARIVVSPGRTAASLAMVALTDSQRLARVTPSHRDAALENEEAPTAAASPAAIRPTPLVSDTPAPVTGEAGDRSSTLLFVPRRSRAPLAAAFVVTGLLGALVTWGFTRQSSDARVGSPVASSIPAASLAISAAPPAASFASASPAAIAPPVSSAPEAPSASAAPSAKKRGPKIADPFGMDRK